MFLYLIINFSYNPSRLSAATDTTLWLAELEFVCNASVFNANVFGEARTPSKEGDNLFCKLKFKTDTRKGIRSIYAIIIDDYFLIQRTG